MADREVQQRGINDDGGCTVDWSWLQGQQIASVRNGLDTLIFTFAGGQTLEVRSLLWQGKPFLSFSPHRDPATTP